MIAARERLLRRGPGRVVHRCAAYENAGPVVQRLDFGFRLVPDIRRQGIDSSGGYLPVIEASSARKAAGPSQPAVPMGSTVFDGPRRPGIPADDPNAGGIKPL